MSGEATVRLATADDAALVARHRVRMFVEIGTVAGGSAVEAAILAASERYLATAIPAGTWIGWIAEVGGVPAGGGAAVLRDSPPGPQLPEGGTMAYLLNFYTETEFRGRGVATRVPRTRRSSRRPSAWASTTWSGWRATARSIATPSGR